MAAAEPRATSAGRHWPALSAEHVHPDPTLRRLTWPASRTAADARTALPRARLHLRGRAASTVKAANEADLTPAGRRAWCGYPARDDGSPPEQWRLGFLATDVAADW